MTVPESLFNAVDALLARSETVPDLPSPEERQRLREAGQYSLNDVAKALQVRRDTLERWEGRDRRSPSRASGAGSRRRSARRTGSRCIWAASVGPR